MADFAEAWNFGPQPEANRPVADILDALQAYWPDMRWERTQIPQPREATLLYLDNRKAIDKLDWRPIWSLDQALRATAGWYRQFHEQGATLTGDNLASYVSDAHQAGASWVQM